MICLILGIFFLITLVLWGIVIIPKNSVHREDWALSAGIATAIFVVTFVIFVPSTINDIAYERQLDQKISMYEEENSRIEAEIDAIVDAYLIHEQETFAELKSEGDAMTLVTLLPDLNSDSIIQKQMEIYMENNEKIKKLQSEKIDIGLIKWKLYFGGR